MNIAAAHGCSDCDAARDLACPWHERNLPVICRECGNDLGPYGGLCLDCLEAGAA